MNNNNLLDFRCNTTINSAGGFCNHVIRNIFCSIFAKKHDIVFTYSYYNEIKELGIELYTSGKKYYSNNIKVNDNEHFFKLLNKTSLNYNIFVLECFFQSPEYANYLREYLSSEDIKQNIINKNIFNDRYNKNNDLFIHVRLSDAVQYNHGFDYYDNVLQELEFENGFISSDEIDHEICSSLIKKYNLQVIQYNEVQTIMFGSTCKYIVLSNGTFSWMIGILGWFSKIFYPDPKLINSWHGDIFIFDDWKKIIYK